MLLWDDTASHDLTIDGLVFMGTHAGVYVGTEADPISYANKAIITLVNPVTLAAASAYPYMSGFAGISLASNYYGNGQTLCFSGDVPAQRYATLTSDAAVSDTVLNVDDSSGFQAGDYVYITKHDATYSSANNATRYTVDSVGTGTITLTSGILGQKRLAGGFVMLTERGYGVQIYCSKLTTYSGLMRFHGLANLYMRGVYAQGIYGVLGYSNNYTYRDNTSRLRAFIIEYCMFENYQHAQAAYYGVTGLIANELGAYISNNLSFGCAAMGSVIGVTSKFLTPTRLVKSGTVYYEENISARSAVNCLTGSGAGLPGAVFTGNIDHNSRYREFGQNNRYDGNYSYGNDYSNFWRAAFGAYLINNVADRTLRGWFSTGLATNLINVTDIDTQINGLTGGTPTMTPTADSYYDYTFVNPNIDLTLFDNTDQVSLAVGSKIKVVDNAQTLHNDLVITPTGIFQRCGNLLADSTAYGSNLYSWRFEPGTPPDVLEYTYDQVIGDQSGHSMFVYMWVKINSANYWSGTHRLPRLYVAYDNGDQVYSQAGESTDWQMLIAPVTLATSYPTITIALNGYTDQTGSDAWFYLGHIGTVLPEGRNVEPGTLSFWSEAEPMAGIASGLSAADVWSVPTSQLVGAGTIGETSSNALTLPLFVGLK
jgi:hypothetical protein